MLSHAALTPHSTCEPAAPADQLCALDGIFWVSLRPSSLDHPCHRPHRTPLDLRDADRSLCGQDPCGNTCPRTYISASFPGYLHASMWAFLEMLLKALRHHHHRHLFFSF